MTTQDLPRWIGRAYVDTRPLEARTRVTIVGYGCDDWNYGANYDYDFAYKQYARTRIGELSDILREADPPEDPGIDNADFRRTYAVSPGPYVKDDAPALCWGDSGGPLYRAGTKGIVGVNALALGVRPNDQFGIYLNGFTRTDARSGSGVAEWLRRAGADVR